MFEAYSIVYFGTGQVCVTGHIFPKEAALVGYADLWGPLSDLLAQLSAIVTM